MNFVFRTHDVQSMLKAQSEDPRHGQGWQYANHQPSFIAVVIILVSCAVDAGLAVEEIVAVS